MASRKRRFLAWYLDFLFFSAPWILIIWGLSSAVPAFHKFSYAAKVAFFVALEVVLIRLVSWSPGHALLGIQRLRIDPFATPQATYHHRPRYIVEPWLKSNERWWTMLFGVLAILSGMKSIVRWTMWMPAIPFMGFQLNDSGSPAVLVCLGVLECAVGCMALRLRPTLLVLGAVFYVTSVVSTLVSWQLWPAWIERCVVARRTFQGVPVREGEVEFMQQFVPTSTVVIGVIMGAWMLLVAWWVYRTRTA